MADYKVTDTELTSIANAIRTRGGTSGQLVFPNGFVSAVNAIPSGGGSSNILAGIDKPTANVGSNGDVYLYYTEKAFRSISGQNYINTNYYAKTNTRIEAAFLPTSISGNGGFIIGAREVASTAANAKALDIHIYAGKFVVAFGGAQQTLSQHNVVYGRVYTVTLEQGLFTINNGEDSFTLDLTEATPTERYPLYIFGLDQQGSYLNNTSLYGSLFYLSIYEGDSLVHHYIPAQENGVACLYDTVEEEYLYNSGNGTVQVVDDNSITAAYAKVSGAWQNLVGTNINDVNRGASA